MIIPEKLRDEWGDYVWWDRKASAPQAAHAATRSGSSSRVEEPLLEGAVEVTLADGKKVALPAGVRPREGVRWPTSTRRRPRR